MKLRINFFLLVLCIPVYFLPAPGGKFDFKRYYILVALFFINLIFNGFKLKKIKIEVWESVYIVTIMISYIIHYYSGSKYGIIAICAFIICTKYIMFDAVKTKDDFEKIIDIIVLLGTMYAVICIIEDFTQFNLYDEFWGRTVFLGGANSFRGGVLRGHGMSTVSTNNSMFLFWLWIFTTYKLYNFGKKYRIPYIVIGGAMLLAQARMTILVAILCQCIFTLKKGVSKAISRFLIILMILSVFLYFNPNIMQYISELFLPIFNELFKSETGSTIAGVSMDGSGERLALWRWVYEDVKNNLLFGKGFVNHFSYSYFNGMYNRVKTSIEVYWLFLLYQKGIFGVLGFIVYQIGNIQSLVSKKKSNNFRVDYRFIMLIGTIAYFVMLFGCSALEELEFYYFIVLLTQVYFRITKNTCKNIDSSQFA